MAIYAIGDIQGCYDELCRLLEHIKFDPAKDQLWFTGDLVNRGPKSLQTLRFVKSLGQAAITVLGNHDLHLLAMAIAPTKTSKKDTLAEVLRADDSEELLYWLRHQYLFFDNQEFCLLHAGLPPQWDLALTRQMAKEAEQALQGDDYVSFFKAMYGNKPDVWQDNLAKQDSVRFTINCLTRLRYCSASGVLDFTYNGAPGTQPAHLLPWFTVPDRKSLSMQIIFGHWSTLGYYHNFNCYGIDTGCLWGGDLTALRLSDSPERFSIACAGQQNPHDFS